MSGESPHSHPARSCAASLIFVVVRALTSKDGLEVHKWNTSIDGAAHLRESTFCVKRPAPSRPVVRIQPNRVNGPLTGRRFRAFDELTPHARSLPPGIDVDIVQIHRSGDGREIPEIDGPGLLGLHSQRADYPSVLRCDQDSRGSQSAGNAALADRRGPTVLAEAPFLVGINR